MPVTTPHAISSVPRSPLDRDGASPPYSCGCGGECQHPGQLVDSNGNPRLQPSTSRPGVRVGYDDRDDNPHTDRT